ncbi:hypothetical protein [Winogradskyella aurantiaca]|uniref:hypothetical protein n=1 Tax=Winogradskyella aurantiaca TaxID=2219558 RepID=UPI000E1E2628|nr:hypothetical protein [Winogradskyella aurantiaca]
MKNLLKLTTALLLTAFLVVSCEEDAPLAAADMVTFEAGSPVEFVEIEGNRVAEVNVYTGNVTGADRTFEIMVNQTATTLDPSAYEVPSSVTVPAGTNVGVLLYRIIDSNIPLAGGTLVLEFGDTGTAVTTQGTPSSSSISISVQYEECPPLNSATLNIVFDAYPGETSWELATGGAVVASGDGYDDPNSVLTLDWCLESGDYEFTIFDSFGDGICCNYGPGEYSITVNGEAVVDGDGSFGASATSSFTIQ